MENINTQKEWQKYCASEIARVTPLLTKKGFTLDQEQPQVNGERYLMQAITTTSGKKLILFGRRESDNVCVVIKATSDMGGTRELEHERECRELLQKINFAYKTFLAPEEIMFFRENGVTVSIQKFIEQKSTFLERPLKEQFAFALKAFEAQESAHASTYEHHRAIEQTFGSINAQGYLKSFYDFKKNISSRNAPEKKLLTVLDKTEVILKSNKEVIEQYSGFLTHTDFVPHNFRIIEENIYLLDYSSLRFGNKYEGWARFINFMTLYNPNLETALVEYVRLNRTPEELFSLKIMRMYRLGEIIWYYVRATAKSDGNLLKLNQLRVNFWTNVLESVVENKPLSNDIRENYIKDRDALRSDEEKIRQIGLH